MASQLFGIFGSVGSGKSTILEAMMFVLYDRSDRLNRSGDNRYYNMLNLQSNNMEIDFTFRANANSKTMYRAYFSARRKKRDFNKVEVNNRGLYEQKEEQWVPLPDADASQILGMTYENFMQAVIIPQGKFREFIDQRPNVRTQMLKDLFQLHRFDLGTKTGALLRKTETAITDLQARLLEIGQISEEALAGHLQELKELESVLVKNQQVATELDQQCQELDSLKKLVDAIADTELELKELTNQAEFFDKKDEQLKAYTKAETFFNEKFRLLEETTVEAEQAKQELQQLKSRIDRGHQQVKLARQALDKKKADYEQREQISQQCQDLLHLIEIKKVQPRRDKITNNLIQVEQQLHDLNSSFTQQHTQVENWEEQLLAAEDKRHQWVTLKEVANWILRKKELEQEEEKATQQIQSYQQQLAALKEKQRSILISYGWPESDQPDRLTEDLIQFQTEIQQQQDTVNQALSELRLQERLTQAADQLVSGQPCLLCGSTEHPQIIHSPSVKSALEEKQEELAELRRKEASFRELQRDIEKLSSQTEAVDKMKKQEERRRGEICTKGEKHRELYRWPGYENLSSEEIDRRLTVAQRKQTTLSKWQQMRQQGQQRLKELQGELDQVRNRQQTLLQQQSSLLATEEQRQSMLKIYQPDDYKDVTLDRIQELHHQKQAQLNDVEQQYEQAQQTYQKFQNGLGTLEGRHEAIQESQEKLSWKAEALNQEILVLMKEKDFEDAEEIRELIALELDVDSEEQAVRSFRNRLHSAEVTLHKLQTEVKGQHYDLDDHRQLRLKAQEITDQVRQQQEQCTLLRQHIRDWQSKQKRTQTIQKQLVQQQERESSLKELSSLFRGSGFVKYASTVLLENLCRVANQRFMQLTQNSLSMELNEDNEFVVRDYLNNGKTRLLKTLSGGQTFQASLCLALALAENVKALNQSEQSFFFLDEGFGSLDKKSLRVVFDTLKSLRKESRIVGIISHVEEMQHEIDVYLSVTRDRELGSQIRTSWE